MREGCDEAVVEAVFETARLPDLELVRPCTLCPHMKRITLARIAASLRGLRHRVEVPAGVAAGARRAVGRMLEVGRGSVS